MKNEENIVMIPFVQHEADMNRMERVNKRLWILIIIMFVGFMAYLLIPTEIVEEVSQDANADNESSITQNIGE